MSEPITCPFCGEDATKYEIATIKQSFVGCGSCGASTEFIDWEHGDRSKAMEMAIEKWNKRVEIVMHGEWEEYYDLVDNGNGTYDIEILHYNCSQCNYSKKIKTNFCPNCGAKMDGGK